MDVRLSQRLEEIGDMRLGKIFLLFFFCLRAIWCRFRYGLDTFYYVPTPGKTSALYRDWLVMLLCRPFYKRVILHWHAAGLAKWLETCTQIRARAFTYRLMKQVDLSIVLSRYNRADAEKLVSQKNRSGQQWHSGSVPRLRKQLVAAAQGPAGGPAAVARRRNAFR